MWDPTNLLFARDKACTLYTESGSTYKKYNVTLQLIADNKCLWLNDRLVNIIENYSQFTFSDNLLWFKRNLYITTHGHHKLVYFVCVSKAPQPVYFNLSI